ncbi:RNA polymerase sigma factor [Sphingobacterium griseoflavum]|uniref:RNA polymerase sigma-70 factor n=1 Tax=Sphingobacterium griseoflavum TaxID=1474952 RepID=A0ABQ3HTG6_9SPHI|nr:sigma-70 family RNA polymerase sigma factor [Sphingobacterium griseoflavum]GHE29819.1 hypothetical protein GCM10017764_11070 [Sphingobacterium griseoflavum]
MAESLDMIFWQRITQGDYQAFNAIYDRYWNILLAIALKKVGDKELAMDIVQDLFIDIWQKRHSIQVQTSLRSYLTSALYFKVFMHFRRQGVQQKHIDQYHLLLETQECGEHFTSARYEESYETLLHAIQQSVHDMPQRMKEVFQLKYYRSLNNQEIAENLGLSTQTVKNQLSKGLQQIRRHMEAERMDTSMLSLIGIFLLFH